VTPAPRTPVDDELLVEQQAYYEARAPEYDDWFERRGRYDRGREATAAWDREKAEVREWLGGLDLAGADVLELAPGTGLWTEVLLDDGATVTAVDGAPAMLDALSARCGGRELTTVRADLFSWTPPRRFDALVSCFFMSHVPDERFGPFCALVADAVREGGQVFLLDGSRVETSTAVDHVLPAACDQTMQRRLDDGRTFRIVKRYRDDDELLGPLAHHGVRAEVRRTATYFHAVLGTRVAS
jgi:SAM-dependent methyltransferase